MIHGFETDHLRCVARLEIVGEEVESFKGFRRPGKHPAENLIPAGSTQVERRSFE